MKLDTKIKLSLRVFFTCAFALIVILFCGAYRMLFKLHDKAIEQGIGITFAVVSVVGCLSLIIGTYYNQTKEDIKKRHDI